MNKKKMSRAALALVPCAIVMSMFGCSTGARFDSAATAADSLITALRADDHTQVEKILGPGAEDLLSSGDAVADKSRIQNFLDAYDQKHLFELLPDGTVSLVVGEEEWPLPFPIVRDWTNGWSFDLAAGKEEILNRRVGSNELNAIQSCLAIVDAERDYAAADPEKTGKKVYAQKFMSDEGHKNGLYWPTKEGEEPSPLGELITKATEEGYARKESGRTPYKGYFYRILFDQGEDAPGGALSYFKDGKMSLGFAVVAWPAEYGDSGVQTYMVNQSGVIYSCDLGKDTNKTVLDMHAFNPDKDWSIVPNAQVVITPP